MQAYVLISQTNAGLIVMMPCLQSASYIAAAADVRHDAQLAMSSPHHPSHDKRPYTRSVWQMPSVSCIRLSSAPGKTLLVSEWTIAEEKWTIPSAK